MKDQAADDPPEDDLTVEGIFDELVVEALEHGDGGDGGAPPRKAGRAAKLITVFGLVLGGAAVFFVVKRLVHDWPLVQPELEHAEYPWLAVAALSAIAGMSSIGWGWRHVMRTLGAEPPLLRTIAWYYVGELGKYVPGGVWPVLGRGELARRGGIPRSRAFTSVALSLGMLYLAAMFTAAAFLPFAVAGKDGGFSPWMLVLLALPVGLVLLHHDVLDWLMAKASKATKRSIKVEVPQWRDSLVLVARYIPTWIFIGTATYAVTRSITTDVSLPPDDVRHDLVVGGRLPRGARPIRRRHPRDGALRRVRGGEADRHHHGRRCPRHLRDRRCGRCRHLCPVRSANAGCHRGRRRRGGRRARLRGRPGRVAAARRCPVPRRPP